MAEKRGQFDLELHGLLASALNLGKLGNVGGAGSLERTRLCSISLLCREKTGNFYKIRAFEGLGPQVSHWKCADFLKNSLRAITGKFFARTGNFFEETGNLSPVSGKPSVVDPQVQILGAIRDLFTCTAAPLQSSSCRARAT